MENVVRHAHVHDVQEVLAALEVDATKGLTKSQLAKRKEKYGLNELEVETKKGILELILNQFDDLLVKILLLAAFISFALTLLDMQSHEVAICDFIEPLVIVMILILNAAVGVWQECNAEKSLDALKQLQPTKAKVLRDGKWEIIDSKHLTIGDIIELSVGNKTPADARIIQIFSTSIKVEQSMLTGESCSVDKYSEKLDPSYKNCEIQLKRNILFSSTAIVAGRCIAVVTNIGMNTEIGQIQHAVMESTNEDTDTPLQIKIDSFGRQLSKIIFVICVTVWVINFKHFSDPIHGSFLYGCLYYFKISVALAVAAIPEGLPAVITTCLALGTRRMVKKNAIVRKLQSVETLGCTTVICSDKTGTLTTNQMTATVFHLFKEATVLKEYQLCQKGETFFFYESCLADDGQDNDSFFNKLKQEERLSSKKADQTSYQNSSTVTSKGNNTHSSKHSLYDGEKNFGESDSEKYEHYPSDAETEKSLEKMHTNVNTIISRGSKILEDKIKKYAYSEYDYHFYMCMVNCNEANIFCNDKNAIVKVFGDSTELALLHFVHNFDIKPSSVKNNAMPAEYERASGKGKGKKGKEEKATSSIGANHMDESSGQRDNKEESKSYPSECISAWRNECQLIKIIEFTRERKLMSVIVENKKKDFILYCKGAPENIINNCNYYLIKNEVKPLTEELKNVICSRVKGMGKRALRTLSFAYRKMKKTDLNVTNAEEYFKLEKDMIYLGGLGIIDPPRKYVGRAINLCHLAGIRVFMITGDNMDTAKAIAKEINILHECDSDDDLDQNSKTSSGAKNSKKKLKCCYSGREFEDFPLELQKEILKNKQRIVFCRTEPKHKKQIVKILKDLGETVAMTGDGVNDAPALKSADIGISMGINGTEVAKEASDIVLADDNFNTIVEAIKEGRCIYNNMKAFIRYLISSNIGEVASIFITALLGIPDSLAPVQLLWVNLVTDGLPATALGFNPPEHDVMKCKPRHKNDNLINGLTLLRYIVIGTYVGVATVSIFVYWYLFYPDMDGHTLVNFYQLSHYNQCKAWGNFRVKRVYGMSEDPCSYFSMGKVKASTLSLSVLVVIEMFNALNALSEYNSLFKIPPWRNMYLVLATIGSLLLHFMILYIPPLAKIFGVVALTPYDWFLVLMWSFPVIIIDEVIKFYAKRQLNKGLSSKQKLE
ncbi:calcium-transporting ATPase, putative [Plasmodium knowlesi strain H]|uniref:P-type Ca(2+) transporter n=3 Tax=Plasmodium knowlesi TaxID=5850 RepID=A0A5K1UR11_PLAKH|nr:calcium-transporting ATPase, putative [Plasmodium knowlesi strain H]OTN66376.1 putative Calcium-transporting ATPase [Plasmodium knowlesi]CAA9986338.1 calcium-transporting ATPase, putative [Plasmodium knowlesi strain H]SBO25583.1 calcium-transporting ATPase, putative [Plasmodium knowlesi strain H]SBO28322.1 calcium-transporting ATPase, putative [Plasmodium knowlesi strain H]VVS75812.1 calcium-transporting ATPase, putative [Plasmodium knowlesi strain H]|eukprot:XP_002257743.1 Sarcoplasmic and endoplasmic reticulum Ca-ATPase, putative [Plasmodium knowlesi strain H]